MDTGELVERLLDILSYAASPDVGPEQADYQLAGIADEIARAQRDDPYGFADALVHAHRQLTERAASWQERDAAWNRQLKPALIEIGLQQEHLAGILHEIAAGHRRRTGEATLVLPSGARVRTQASQSVQVAINDAGAFMEALAGREDVPEGVVVQPPAHLAMLAAKAYARQVLLAKGEGSELLPGVRVIPSGTITSTVQHEGIAQ